MATNITIPTFDFASFYYGEILEALVQYKRINAPELTDESDSELLMQILKAFALVAHLNNTNLDSLANENTLPTSQLEENVRNMLRLIDYELSPASPATVDVVYELSKVFNASFELISEDAQAATENVEGEDIIYFESLTSLTIDRTDQLSYVLGEEASVFTDYTTKANSATTPADDWQPWATPTAKDSIYFGHKHVMFDTLTFNALTTAAANITGVWEFYDGDFSKVAPTSVTNLGGTLEFNINGLLGTTDRSGTLIRCKLNETGAFEDVFSTFSGGTNKATTTGLLGQSSPSTTADDYTIGSDWSILENVTDGSAQLTQAGEVTYTVPQTTTQNWITKEIDSKTAYWLRFRIISVSTPTAPVFQQSKIDDGKQYALRSCTQGRTHTEDPLGSSDGSDNQEFETSKEYFIWGSETVTVDSETWTRVDNFLNSESGSKHYKIELGTNDLATVVFGGGGNGLAPPAGTGNIAITYRYGGNADGNVGANTVVVDKTGLTFVSNLYNPRQAIGWSAAEGSTETSLELAKIAGPASVRTKTVAIGPDDVSELAINFEDSTGASPYSRAKAFEEVYGSKTVEVVLVAAGGGQATTAQLDEIEKYFNGDKYAVPPLEKHLVANQEVTAVNYSQKSINITATVYTTDTTNITSAAVQNALIAILQPEALRSDGVTYEWEFGEDIPTSRLNHVIFDIDDSITKVTLTTPSSDVVLQTKELPTSGTLTITVLESS